MPALIEETVACFVKELECDQCSLEILLFLMNHPGVKASSRQISEGVSFPLVDVIRAIGFLLNKGLITASQRNDLLYYSLPRNKAVRRRVAALSNLGKIKWQELLQQIA